MIDYEGISTLMFAISSMAASTYALYRTIVGDRKMDRIAEKQEQTHLALTDVVGVVAGVELNVAKVEKATNSLKDALVDTTKTAWLLKGRNEGIAAEKARSGTADPTQPDGAPTVEDLRAASAAQVTAVANDQTMRAKESKTIKP
jgi:hypothetical protein